MEMFCYRRRFVKETFCRGDVLLRRRFVRRRFVEETFCKETFCMCVEQSWVSKSSRANIMQMSHDIPVPFSSFSTSYISHTSYMLERLSSWSTSRIRRSWPRPRIRLNLVPTLSHMSRSCLSWPTQYLLVCPTVSCFTRAPSLANRTA
jgi:hypothetical protein